MELFCVQDRGELLNNFIQVYIFFVHYHLPQLYLANAFEQNDLCCKLCKNIAFFFIYNLEFTILLPIAGSTNTIRCNSAKWIKKIRDRTDFSLNYEKYKAKLDSNEEEAKRFDKLADYQTDLSFKSLPYEIALMEQDSTLKTKRERWHESLSKDVYIEEALNVLNDLKMSYEVKLKVASSIKN